MLHKSLAERSSPSFINPSPPPAIPRAHDSACNCVCKQACASHTRTYRCSKCGKVGHNVRSCPGPPGPAPSSTWYRQRCGICGQTGHNARNCNARARCRVCNGSGKLKCSKCGGGSTLHQRVLAGKRKIARLSRGAVFFDDKKGTEAAEDVLVDKDGRIGGNSVKQVRRAKQGWGEGDASSEMHDEEDRVCNRCLGTGFLTCMACTSDD